MKEPGVYVGFWRFVGGKLGDKSTLYHIAFALLIVLSGNSVGASDDSSSRLYEVDIPASNAAEGLNRLAEQTGAVFLFPYDLAKSRPASAVKGQYTLTDALERLLQGSGLSGGLSEKGVVTISSREGGGHNHEETTMHTENTKKSLLAKIAAAMVVAFSGTANINAQEDESADESNVLEELIVTATRRDTDLQSAIMAATVMSGDLMKKKGVYNVTDLQYAAPSIVISDEGNSNTFNMRGVGRSNNDIELPGAIQLYRDKVPMFPGYFQNEPYFDMASVEILRGPQGTLAGKSAGGGAVFFRTNDAAIGENNAYLETALGNFELWEVNAMANLTLSEDFAIRFAGTHLQRDHFYDAIVPDETAISQDYIGDPGTRDLNAGRVSMTWQPNENFTGKLKIDLNNLDFGGILSTDYGVDPSRPKVCCGIEYKYIDESTRGILDLAWNFDNGMSVTSVTGYQVSETISHRSSNNGYGPYDAPTTANANVAFRSAGEFTLFSQEFNLISSSDQRLRWVTGVFYQYILSDIPAYPEDGTNLRRAGLGFPFVYLTTPWYSPEKDFSVFGNINYDISDTVQLELGLRWSNYERQATTDFYISPDQGRTQGPTVRVGGFHARKEEDSTDWKIGMNWAFKPEHYFYTFAARGHQTGGIRLSTPPPKYFDEAEVYDVEAGLKSTWADGQIQTQIGGYYQIVKGFQAVFSLSTDTVGSQVRNAEDDSTIYGIEINAQAYFGNLSFDFGGAWTVSELGTFSDVLIPAQLLPWYPGAVPGTTTDLSGEQSPFAPELTFNFGVQYDFEFGNTLVSPRLDVAYIDELHAGLFNVPPNLMEDRTLVGLEVNVENGPWYGRFYVENLLDDYFLRGIQNEGQTQYFGGPRMYGVMVGRHFDW
jgi:iron complex outermembrane receptor protein